MNTGFKDQNGRPLRIGDLVYYYIDYLEEYVKGKIIEYDDIYRISHSLGIDILSVENAEKIRKVRNGKNK